MTEKSIRFDGFLFPIDTGLEYLQNDALPESDFLFVNDPGGRFSMYFEKNFPVFSVPEKTERDYGLFELKRKNRIIKFFCPEKRENLDTAVWYFYVQLLAEDGAIRNLPGQVRVGVDDPYFRLLSGKPKFIEVLETVSFVGQS